MTANDTELDAMRRAIALSAFGLGRTSPNPPVGCVILDSDGQVVGQGYHERKGSPHAEVNALTAAGKRARGGTAVVTLEPCNHYGRTPPCHQALLDAGITRTVIALSDPTSRGDGGTSLLRQAGMDVEAGVLADEASLVLEPWLTTLHTKRPQVIWLSRPESAIDSDVATTLSKTDPLRQVTDVILYENGIIEECIPGSHNSDVMSLAPVILKNGADTALTTLYEQGIRSIVLVAITTVAETFLAQQLIDRIVIDVMPHEPSSDAMSNGMAFLSKDFSLTEVTRHDNRLRITCMRH